MKKYFISGFVIDEESICPFRAIREFEKFPSSDEEFDSLEDALAIEIYGETLLLTITFFKEL